MDQHTSSTNLPQPAAEIPQGQHAYQQRGGEERWTHLTRAELIERLQGDTPPAFRSVLGATATDDDGKPIRLAGPFYADFDGDLEETCAKFIEFLDKIADHGVSLAQCRLYATGGRGFHVEVPQGCFMTSVPDEGIEALHLAVREMAMALYVDTCDLRVYSARRMWRVPNVERDNGAFKVALTVEEALSITPARYAELCAAPRPHPTLEAPALAPKLAALFVQAREKVFKATARRKRSSKSADEFKKMTGGTVPPTIDNLLAGRCRLKDGTGWNQIALQIALIGHGFEMTEDDLLERCRGLISSHTGDGDRYSTPRKRERELRNQYRYTANNAAYEVSVPAVLALLDRSEPADDLRDLVADVPDHGFSTLDLMTGHGKGRKLRTDLESLLHLLLRDARLDGLCYFDEFGPMPRAGASWRAAMSMDHAPDEIGPLSDDHTLALRHWFAREWGLQVGKEAAHDVMLSWAHSDSRNSVRDRLEGYAREWDGEPRLDSWLIDHAHAVCEDDGEDFTPLVRAAGTKWLLSAVARVFRPGCQADVALILTGAQGYRKSTILRVLGEGLGKDAYADGFSLDGDHKAALERLRGRAIVEWAEMTGLTKRDVREVKNFVSQRDDAYRASYERMSRKWPRTAVIAGTSNESELFADATGNRRFWTVEVGRRITREDMARFEAIAPQLWGEACFRYKAGEKWWIDPDEDAALHAMALSRQEAAQVSTVFDALAVELASAVKQQRAVLAKHVATLHTEWFPTLEMRSMLVEMNGDRDFSNLEWQQMVTALKRQGWEQRKRTKARTVFYRIGDDLRAAVSGLLGYHAK